MIGGDNESGGEVGGIELVRSPRVDVGELMRDAHATFVPLCEIGPSILFDVVNSSGRQKTAGE